MDRKLAIHEQGQLLVYPHSRNLFIRTFSTGPWMDDASNEIGNHTNPVKGKGSDSGICPSPRFSKPLNS